MEFIQKYLSHHKIKTLPKEEMQALVTRAQGGDKAAFDKLVIHNLPLVFKITNRYLASMDAIVNFDDLFEEGVLGLMKALKKFDVSRNLELSTYACWFIEQHMERYIDDNRGAVRIPVYLQVLKRKYHKLKKEDDTKSDDFYIRLLAANNEQSVANLRYDISHTPRDIRIDHGLDLDGEEDVNSIQLESIVDENQINLDLLDAQTLLSKLSSIEQEIMKYRLQGWTFQRIGQVINLSRERVRQIEELALFKMQSMIKTVRDGDVFKTRERLMGEFIQHTEEITMKIDTSKPCMIYGVCSDCLNKALSKPENKVKSQLGIPQWVEAECDVCHRIKPCAKPEIYGFPVFEVKR